MIIAQYFVEFIFYSFLGWVWESIYCTIVEKKWADRGFLFGPICPIYGSSVVVASIVFSSIPALSDPSFPILGIFIICAIGSAVAEYGTHWFLEKRFHARWWDYSDMPLNLEGRICLPVSVGFGIAGIVVVKFLIPAVNNTRAMIPDVIYVFFALIFAAAFGADFALTEVSLSKLLKDVEQLHNSFNEKAQANYEKIVSAPKDLQDKVKTGVLSIETMVSKEKESMEVMLDKKKEEFTAAYIEKADFAQKLALSGIQKLTPIKGMPEIPGISRQQIFESLKNAINDNKKK